TFTSAVFPPAGWSYVGYNPNNKMQRAPSVGGFGSNTGCLLMDNYSGAEDISRQVDYMILPRLDLTGSLPTTFEFNVAYARFTMSTTDTLRVMVSTDCGATWNQVYFKYGDTLATAPVSNPVFVPLSGQWR